MDYISLAVGILLLILSIPLFFGKGSFLIAGYNTANQEEKAKYDEKKLCRTVAITLLVVGLLIVLTSFSKTKWVLYTAYGIAIVFPLLTLIYANLKCKK